MSFAHWASTYINHRIAPVPLDETGKPMVRGWARAGLNAATKWTETERLAAAPALGFRAGRASGVTVLDVDSEDERQLRYALDRHGHSPVIARSRGGRFHVWYRHTGEPRSIRPWGKTIPVDLLGGGLIVAPPSLGRCRFIAGSLDDIDRLPAAQGLEGVVRRPGTAGQGQGLIQRGERTKALWEHCMKGEPYCETEADLIEEALIFRASALDVHDGRFFSEQEAIRQAKRAWKLTQEGKNYFVGHSEIDALAMIDQPDALALYLVLRQAHAGRRDEFVLAARALAEKFRWGAQRVRAARDRLVAEGMLDRVHAGGRRRGDPPRYRWGHRLRREPPRRASR